MCIMCCERLVNYEKANGFALFMIGGISADHTNIEI